MCGGSEIPIGDVLFVRRRKLLQKNAVGILRADKICDFVVFAPRDAAIEFGKRSNIAVGRVLSHQRKVRVARMREKPSDDFQAVVRAQRQDEMPHDTPRKHFARPHVERLFHHKFHRAREAYSK